MDERTQTTRLLLERVTDLIEHGDVGSASLTEARNLIAEARIQPGQHTGADPDVFDERMTYEWILGQFADVIDTGGWFAMNSGINIARHHLDKYSTSSPR